MQFNKLYLSISLLLIGAIWVACVDIPSGPGTNVNPNIRSLTRFMHALEGTGAGSISIDGASAGPSMSFLGNSGYLDTPAGSRSLAFGGSTGVLSLSAEQQSTVIVYRAADSSVAYLNLPEGHKDKNNGDPTSAKVKFVNVARGSAANLVFTTDSATGPVQSGNVAFGAARQYTNLTPGSHAYYVVSPASFTGGLSSTTNSSTGTSTVRSKPDSGVVYSFSLARQNNLGFYTAANFRSPDANGQIVRDIVVSGQTMSFPSARLNGTNEVPPVSAPDTATGTFSLTPALFTYSVNVSCVNAQGFYTAAHFHGAPAGVNGNVIKAIDVTKQTMTFDTAAIRGANEVPPVLITNARGTGTFTLWRDSLKYSVTVTRDSIDSTFTQGHFHRGVAGVAGPVVKNIIVGAPWSSPATRTFTGRWARTDSTQPLTDALIDDIIAGRIYVNFHSQAFPAGVIRAQVIVTARTSNIFSGTWTPASGLTAAMSDSIAKSLLYVNFHTAANPGGQIRAQVVPNATTTNTYSGIWRDGSLTTALLKDLGEGRMFVSFESSRDANARVTGQIAFDPAGGIPGAASLPSFNYEAGKMYTIVASGSGAGFQLTQMEDRRFGFAKPEGGPAKPVQASTQTKE